MKVHVKYQGHVEMPVDLGKGIPLKLFVEGDELAELFSDIEGDLHIQVWGRKDQTRDEGRARATGAITMTYGCGHVIPCMNGDIMWPACPWCNPHLRELWTGREPARLPDVKPVSQRVA